MASNFARGRYGSDSPGYHEVRRWNQARRLGPTREGPASTLWQQTVLLIADGDGDDMTDTYINSIQVSSTKFSDAQLIALGGPSAGGIPVIVETASVETPPVSLTITQDANNLTISWPASATGFVLRNLGLQALPPGLPCGCGEQFGYIPHRHREPVFSLA